MTHRNWLCGVVLRRGIEGPLQLFRKGFLLAHRGRQCKFVLVGIFFFFLLLLVPPEESFSLHLSGSLLMVFDGLGGVLNKWCSPL